MKIHSLVVVVLVYLTQMVRCPQSRGGAGHRGRPPGLNTRSYGQLDPGSMQRPAHQLHKNNPHRKRSDRGGEPPLLHSRDGMTGGVDGVSPLQAYHQMRDTGLDSQSMTYGSRPDNSEDKQDGKGDEDMEVWMEKYSHQNTEPETYEEEPVDLPLQHSHKPHPPNPPQHPDYQESSELEQTPTLQDSSLRGEEHVGNEEEPTEENISFQHIPIHQGQRDDQEQPPQHQGQTDDNEEPLQGHGRTDDDEEPPINQGQTDVDEEPPVNQGQTDVDEEPPINQGQSDDDEEPPVHVQTDDDKEAPLDHGQVEEEEPPVEYPFLEEPTLSTLTFENPVSSEVNLEEKGGESFSTAYRNDFNELNRRRPPGRDHFQMNNLRRRPHPPHHRPGQNPYKPQPNRYEQQELNFPSFDFDQSPEDPPHFQPPSKPQQLLTQLNKQEENQQIYFKKPPQHFRNTGSDNTGSDGKPPGMEIDSDFQQKLKELAENKFAKFRKDLHKSETDSGSDLQVSKSKGVTESEKSKNDQILNGALADFQQGFQQKTSEEGRDDNYDEESPSLGIKPQDRTQNYLLDSNPVSNSDPKNNPLKDIRKGGRRPDQHTFYYDALRQNEESEDSKTEVSWWQKRTKTPHFSGSTSSTNFLSRNTKPPPYNIFIILNPLLLLPHFLLL